MKPITTVIPGRDEVANPESITPVGGYGFRALGLRPRPGMTPHVIQTSESDQ
jgi:hypothetical protein